MFLNYFYIFLISLVIKILNIRNKYINIFKIFLKYLFIYILSKFAIFIKEIFIFILS